MRSQVGEAPGELVGWTGGAVGQPVYHGVRSHDGEGLGISRCSVALSDVRDRSHIRRYERPCHWCWPRGKPADDTPRSRRTANIRPPIVPAVSPLGPLDVRVTADGLLGVRSSDGLWIVFDPDRPLMLETADDRVAEKWRTWRTTWPTEELVNSIAIADRYDQHRSVVAKWRTEPGFPPVFATVGDRVGWLPEQWPGIEAFVGARATRRGRKPSSE